MRKHQCLLVIQGTLHGSDLQHLVSSGSSNQATSSSRAISSASEDVRMQGPDDDTHSLGMLMFKFGSLHSFLQLSLFLAIQVKKRLALAGKISFLTLYFILTGYR